MNTKLVVAYPLFPRLAAPTPGDAQGSALPAIGGLRRRGQDRTEPAPDSAMEACPV